MGFDGAPLGITSGRLGLSCRTSAGGSQFRTDEFSAYERTAGPLPPDASDADRVLHRLSEAKHEIESALLRLHDDRARPVSPLNATTVPPDEGVIAGAEKTSAALIATSTARARGHGTWLTLLAIKDYGMGRLLLKIVGKAGWRTTPAKPRIGRWSVVCSEIGSPRVAHASLAAIALRPVRKRAIERAADREPVDEYDVGAGGDQEQESLAREAGDGEG